jgi:hypothetical protein
VLLGGAGGPHYLAPPERAARPRGRGSCSSGCARFGVSARTAPVRHRNAGRHPPPARAVRGLCGSLPAWRWVSGRWVGLGPAQPRSARLSSPLEWSSARGAGCVRCSVCCRAGVPRPLVQRVDAAPVRLAHAIHLHMWGALSAMVGCAGSGGRIVNFPRGRSRTSIGDCPGQVPGRRVVLSPGVMRYTCGPVWGGLVWLVRICQSCRGPRPARARRLVARPDW